MPASCGWPRAFPSAPRIASSHPQWRCITRRSAAQRQLSAHRYLARRSARSLRTGQPGEPAAPGQHALGMGAVLAAILLGVAGVLAVVRPQPGLGDAPMVVDLASGALYVRVDDTVHPVFNLVSARLIAGPDSAGPRAVTSSAIERARRGPPLGIPGAPATLAPLYPTARPGHCATTPPGPHCLSESIRRRPRASNRNSRWRCAPRRGRRSCCCVDTGSRSVRPASRPRPRDSYPGCSSTRCRRRVQGRRPRCPRPRRSRRR